MKSNTILWIFLAIILIAAVAYLAAFIVRRKNEGRLKELEERKMSLFELPVNEEVDEVKQMHLVGQSQNTFREWQEKWSDLSTASFAELETKIFDAENLNQTFKFGGVKKAIVDAEETMDSMESKVADIRVGLKYLRDREAENSVAVQEALDKYEEVKTQITEEEAKFGPAIESLKKEIDSIDNQFKSFVALNTSGDPMEAGLVLAEAEEQAKALEEKMTVIPGYFEELDQEFPIQMKEIVSGHETLVKQKYQFPEVKIEEQIKEVNQKIGKNVNNLKEMDLELVKSENEAIAEQIDGLYNIMEQEIESKQFVDKNVKTTNEYIEHISKNNKQLKIELDHVSQSYALNNNEQGRAEEFEKQVDNIAKAFKETEEKINKNTVVYSDAEFEIKNHLEALDEVENNQIAINESVTEMREGEKMAQSKIDTFEFDMRAIKRKVDKQRLPGLPKDYLDFFYVATDRIEELSHELNKMRIDMDRINQLVSFCEEDIQMLDDKTEELIDSAALTEQMLQYSNRYRMTDEDMAEAVTKSYELFTEEHRYNDALDEIGVALEQVEPGAFKRIEAAYFSTKGNNTQF
ncbi:septation ring formation regulator EzrA [Vagococcus coleopterorum]|uniref:Septation ring formation regulator EzrA n=1 Tax=Vagococcus coleopterorum TaxID=2714946 RepID=A0A6G8APK3_9ENTE|nr:septation ring formation regulator EzrA [Vagococcus coleopterorum]QIL46917.1 septation ring formation regulator EzrA [Vagococcus coleopterorum]